MAQYWWESRLSRQGTRLLRSKLCLLRDFYFWSVLITFNATDSAVSTEAFWQALSADCPLQTSWNLCAPGTDDADVYDLSDLKCK